ncbi:MAG: NAD-dependent epimerase/dehydratase family protein [Chitinophagales bacterium]|nr:NAD-dependent epimerase/dehydratase family protein [Chitinophagales bacterium]
MILLTGASGYLGSEIAKQLHEQNIPFKILVRTSSNIDYIKNYISKNNILHGDILDIITLEDAMKGISTIIHCAAKISYQNKDINQLYKINTEGTANVINVALAKGVKNIVHISSIAAIGAKPNKGIIDETTKFEKNDYNTQYGISKSLAEKEIYRGIQEGINAVVLQVGIIVGKGNDQNKATQNLIKRVATNRMPFYASGSNGFVAVQDVASIAIQFSQRDLPNENFIVVGENLSFKDYISLIAESTNATIPNKVLKNYMINLYLIFETLKSWITGKSKSINKEQMLLAQVNFEYDNSKIKNYLPFEFTSIAATLKHIEV